MVADKQKTNSTGHHSINTDQSYKTDPSEILSSWSKLAEQRVVNERELSNYSDIDSLISDEKDDSLLVNDYVNEIMGYYRRVESIFAPSNDYMAHQTDINEKMRFILIDWLVEVHLKFKLMPETLYLTVSCIDRFLTEKKVSRKSLQLVGVSAMLIASKYEEIWAPEVRDFVYISDKAFSREKIISMEKTMLNTLGFKLTAPTGYFFLQHFLSLANAGRDVSILSWYLLELSLLDYKMLKFSCSQIAAATIYMANKLTFKVECWSCTMKQYTQYSIDDLQSCTKALYKIQKKIHSSSQSAIIKKFSSSTYDEVARFL